MKKKIITVFAIFLFLSAYGAQYTQEDAQRYSAYYSNGMQYLKNQQYTSAINEFRKVLRFAPYDETIQDALANAYFARAQYYRTATKEVKKAIVDYKSAYFYSKCWRTSQTDSMAQLSANCQKNIIELEKRLNMAQSAQSRFQEAKVLKAQGELAAAGYDFYLLKTGQYEKEAIENLGNIYKNLNNLSQAMDYFKMALDLDPKNAKMHFLYGVMLDEANNFEASMEQYNLALQYGDKSPELMEILENKWTQNIVNNPQNAQSYINLGAIYQKQGNFEGAKAQYLKAYQLDSSDDTSLYNLSSLYVQQKKYLSAIDIYNKLLEKNPKNVEVLEYKANAYKELAKFDDVIKTYDTILAINPARQDIKAQKDDIIYNHFSGEKLMSYFYQKALSSPNSYEDQFNYAYELHKNKNYEGAVQYYKKAQSLNPAREETYLNLAQIFIEQKNYKEANDICQKGLMILPDNQKIAQYLQDVKNYTLSSQFDSATKLYEEKQYSKALAQYLNIPNKTTEVNMAIASCYWQMKDYKNANKYYQEVLAYEPNNQDALLNSAWAYYSMNNYNSAKEGLNRLLSINPQNADAKNLLAEIEQNEVQNQLQEIIDKYDKKDFAGSLAQANKYLSKNPDDEYAQYYKGLNLEELKKPNDAIKQYKHLISKSPDFAPAYYSLAVAEDNAEKYQEAVSHYEKFLSLKQNEKDEMTDFSLNRIKELKEYLGSLNANK